MSLYVSLQIVDSPRFGWRGALLDVGRHFFPVPFIYKFLDVCAFYKINKFHWHLTEDQVSCPPTLPLLEHALLCILHTTPGYTAGLSADLHASWPSS